MKIVNISANAPYNDYWGYQENLYNMWYTFGHEGYR